jgi:hypothetical protein
MQKLGGSLPVRNSYTAKREVEVSGELIEDKEAELRAIIARQ